MEIKDKLLRYRVMETHINMVKAGKYGEARLVLRLLNYGRVHLGLDDECWAVETALEKLGCVVSYSRNYNRSTVYLYCKRR